MMNIPMIKPCTIRLAGILRRLIFLFTILYIKEGNMCSSNVCLTWRLSQDELTLICKINKMYLRVFFDDPYGNTQADCLPPYKHNCEAYYQNGSVYFNSTTKEAIFTTKGTIDHRLNGKWGCRYGTSRDKSEVFVLIRHTTDINVSNFTFDTTTSTITRQSKMETTTKCHTLTGAIIFDKTGKVTFKYLKFHICSITLSEEGSVDCIFLSSNPFLVIARVYDAINNMKHNITIENEIKTVLSQRAFYGSMTAGIAFVLIGVVVCIIRISHHQRRVKLRVNTETVFGSRVQRRIPASSNSGEATELNHSGYETINENEMLSYPALMSRIRDDNVYRRTTLSDREANTDSKSSSSTTYIDVIDGVYLNPYQSMAEPRDLNDIHLYSFIPEKNKSKRRFTFPTSSCRVISFLSEIYNPLSKTVSNPTFGHFEIQTTKQAKQSVIRCNDNLNIKNPRFHSSNSLNKNNYFRLKEPDLSSYPHRCPLNISKYKSQQEHIDDLPDFSDACIPRNVMSTLL